MSVASPLPVLALNAGSSSLKFGLYLVEARSNRLLVSGIAETAEDRGGAFRVTDADGNALECDARPTATPREAIDRVAGLLAAQHLPAPAAIGHRIVHGGPHCRRHALIDEEVIRQLEGAVVLAPLHLRPHWRWSIRQKNSFQASRKSRAWTLRSMRACRKSRARCRSLVSCARWASNATVSGLSCESIVHQLAADLPLRLVIAHLGHGASVTAVANGRSVDASMGMTPSGGVIMSTRCGDIDPGVIEYLVRELRYDATRLEALIDHRSWMQGISDFSGDMREVRAAAASNPDARLAIAMFCHSVRKQIGAMSAALGGIDMLVFTGGIGENDAATRETICGGMDRLGINVGSEVVRVMRSQEDARIAQHAWQIAAR